MDAFAYAQRGTGIRAMLGRFKFLHRDPKWWEACKHVTDYADQFVDEALKLHAEKKTASLESTSALRLVEQMANDTQDRLTLRSHIISVFSPAHDGAAIVLSNAMFHLARNPRIWSALRAEILSSKDQTLSYDLLNSYKYLKWVLQESRLLKLSISQTV